MKAVLLVPETKRIGLTGKPLLNQQGIVGSLKGSFTAGQRVTLLNLKGITQKIAEAQAAMSGAETNIHKSGETIDDIQKGSNEMANVIDYWTRWDNKGVHDKYANIQFLATALSMDKVRTAMLGESVDPMPWNEKYILPRGCYWDPIFSWQKHSLEFKKDQRFVTAYSTRGWIASQVKSLNGLLQEYLTKFGTFAAKIAAVYALNLTIAPLMSSVWYATFPPWAGFQTFNVCQIQCNTIQSTLAGSKIQHNVITWTYTAVFAAALLVLSLISILISAINSYGHVELMGNNPSCYLNSTVMQNFDLEQWFTYAYIDPLVDKTTSLIYSALEKSITAIFSFQVKQVAHLTIAYAAITAARSMPDIPSEHGPNPNPAAIPFATTAAEQVLAQKGLMTTAGNLSTIGVIPSIGALVVEAAKMFMFATTRVNTGYEMPLNSPTIPSYSSGKPGKKYHSLNELGSMMEIPIDNWTSTVANIASAFSVLSIGSSNVSGAIVQLFGAAREESCSEVVAGGSTKYDSYIITTPNNEYKDWWGHQVDIQGWTATVGSIAGTGQLTTAFYGDLIPRTGNHQNYYSMSVRSTQPLYLGTKFNDGMGYYTTVAVTYNGRVFEDIKVKVNGLYIDIPFDPSNPTPIKNGYPMWTTSVVRSPNSYEADCQTQPGKSSYESGGRGLSIWSHVYNENLYGIKSSQIGGRQIEKTIIIKTRYEFGTGIYRAFQAFCKCSGEDKLHLLLERDMQRFYNGGGADIMMAEQVIWNFDPENPGDFFTGNRAGKISEMFCYTFDGHQISFRPNLQYKDNYLMGEFVNREVTGYDKFVYKTYPPTNNVEGNITSYENPYR